MLAAMPWLDWLLTAIGAVLAIPAIVYAIGTIHGRWFSVYDDPAEREGWE